MLQSFDRSRAKIYKVLAARLGEPGVFCPITCPLPGSVPVNTGVSLPHHGHGYLKKILCRVQKHEEQVGKDTRDRGGGGNDFVPPPSPPPRPYTEGGKKESIPAPKQVASALPPTSQPPLKNAVDTKQERLRHNSTQDKITPPTSHPVIKKRHTIRNKKRARYKSTSHKSETNSDPFTSVCA